MEEQMMAEDKSPLRLTDEQAAEVRRRLANSSAKRIPADEVFKRFHRQ
jgi:putative addiction module component (TIGR02574 family)